MKKREPARATSRRTGLARLFFLQMGFRWGVTLLLFAALCAVTALYTYTRNSSRFQNRSMQLIMKGAGHNLWFLDRSADLLEVLSASPRTPTFPEDRVHAMATDRRLASTYWGNLLQQAIDLRGRRVILTGLEVVDDHQVTEEKAHLLAPLEPGQADLGHSLAADWNLAPGGHLAVAGREYTVRSVHPFRGSADDQRLWVPLPDAQEWLGLPGRANMILGFLCMRGLPLEEGLQRLGQRVADEHPGFQVVPVMNLLEARALARLTTVRYLHYLLLVVLLVTVLLVAVIGWMEVNERRRELAVMLSLGAGYPFLLGLFLSKLILLGVVASSAGFLVGSFLAVSRLAPFLVTHTQPVTVVWPDFPHVLLITLGMVLLAALFPLGYLLRLEPTAILAEE